MNQAPTHSLSKIAYIKARWHSNILDIGYQAFVRHLATLSNQTPQVDVYDVPGAFEIPLLAKKLSLERGCDAVVASAFVVDGGIYRHEFVADAVLSGLMQVQLETGIPVLSMVLTPHQFGETKDHQDFFLRHFEVKGREAADACWEVLQLHGA